MNLACALNNGTNYISNTQYALNLLLAYLSKLGCVVHVILETIRIYIYSKLRLKLSFHVSLHFSNKTNTL